MSEKSIAEKLHIEPGKSVMLFNPPTNNDELLGGVKDDLSVSDGDPADILLAYIENRTQLERNMLVLKSKIKNDGTLWIAYQEASSTVDADLNRNSISAYAQKKDLKGVTTISINKDWTALQLKIID